MIPSMWIAAMLMLSPTSYLKQTMQTSSLCTVNTVQYRVFVVVCSIFIQGMYFNCKFGHITSATGFSLSILSFSISFLAVSTLHHDNERDMASERYSRHPESTRKFFMCTGRGIYVCLLLLKQASSGH